MHLIKRIVIAASELTGTLETLRVVGDLVVENSGTIPAALRHGARSQARTHPGGHAGGTVTLICNSKGTVKGTHVSSFVCGLKRTEGR